MGAGGKSPNINIIKVWRLTPWNGGKAHYGALDALLAYTIKMSGTNQLVLVPQTDGYAVYDHNHAHHWRLSTTINAELERAIQQATQRFIENAYISIATHHGKSTQCTMCQLEELASLEKICCLYGLKMPSDVEGKLLEKAVRVNTRSRGGENE